MSELQRPVRTMSDSIDWMLCAWCRDALVDQPGLCEACRQEPDAVEFARAHDKGCGCGWAYAPS